MKLYEIDQAILECVDQETGEIVDTERLDALEMEREQKISNVACWYKDLKAENEAIKAEKQTMDKRMKVNNNIMDSLKSFLDYALGGTKFKDGRCSIGYRKSQSVEVDEAVLDSLPDEFIKIEKSARKTELKKAIEEGQTFEGVSIVEKNNIQIR